MLLFNVKTIFVFFAVTLLLLTGCSREDSGSQTGGSMTNTGAGVSTGDSDLMSIYQAALADPRRPAEEVARDAGRKPIQVLQFFGIAPGQRVVDISSGDGYYSRIISGIVGSGGSIVAQSLPLLGAQGYQNSGITGAGVKVAAHRCGLSPPGPPAAPTGR